MSGVICVGDRFTRGGDRITITKVNAGFVDYAVMHEGSTDIWSEQEDLPLPESWVRAGSGPEEIWLCGNCELREVEPGMVYCGVCLTRHAAEWSSLSEAQALEKTVNLGVAMIKASRPARGSPGTGRVGQDGEEESGGGDDG